MFRFAIGRRQELCVLVATAVLLTLPTVTPGALGLELPPPNQGGKTLSLGMPPVYKGRAGFELVWHRPGKDNEMGGVANLGFMRDLGSPVVGIAALAIEGYAGVRSQEFDGGARGLYLIPSFHIAAGYDYNFTDSEGSFLLGLNLPIRRGGIFGRGSTLDLRWMPGYDNTFSVGIGVPLWGKNLGKTRPRHDSVKLVTRDPERLDTELADPALQAPLEELRERAAWVARLTQPFAESSGGDPRKAMAPAVERLQAHLGATDGRFPVGHTLNEEIRVYHETLDHAFSLATGESNDLGRRVSAAARQYLLDDVLYPYNYLLGQRKTDDELSGMVALAQADFARWLLGHVEIPRQQAINAFYVFQTLCDLMEENRRELRDRWEDSRFVWLPLQYGLKPEEHDSQAELNAIIEHATRASFTYGNRVWYVMNEQFQWEIARSVMRAEDYHVLWIHDIRGKNGQGKPDAIAYRQVRIYLKALLERVRAYDDVGKLPVYMIFLDQHYFEINKSRLWLRLLNDPLDYELGLPKEYKEWEQELREIQAELRVAVEESDLLRIERSQYGDDWLKNQIKVQINITNPADPSFWSWHVAGIIPMPDNNMRDHRKIAFYDISEEDPYRGMAMFTGMGIGEHYVGANWEDRAIMIQGPGALAVKDACRQLVAGQGFDPDEMPFPLRQAEFGATYDEQITAEAAKFPDWVTLEQRAVLQLHNETGFARKPVNPAKAVMYSLMPRGSTLLVPDSLWQSYVYASLLAGSSLRGCRVAIIAPTKDSAPSAGSPQLARAHDLMGRLIVFGDELASVIDAENGLLKVGLFHPQQGVGDLASRFDQSARNLPSWAEEFFKVDPAFMEMALNAEALLDSLDYRVEYLMETESAVKPKLHLKANFLASQVGWEKLIARPEWAGVLREYIIYLARQSTSAADDDHAPDVHIIPEALAARVWELVDNFHRDLTPAEREQLAYFFTVGSTNMDYRSMCLDGEVMITLAGWSALSGLMDFMLLTGLCEWLETTEELDALLPPPGGFTRSFSGLIKLLL